MNARTRFLNALNCCQVDRPPVWFMRQAGRHLPEYRELRARADFLELCRNPALNAEVSCQPWRRYGLDAVIVFNDILIPLKDMGLELEFSPGPVFSRPIAVAGDLARLQRPDYAAEPPAVAACLSEIRRQVQDEAGVLGFVGAPFTVACYALGGASGGVNALAKPVRFDPSRAEVLQKMCEKLLDVLCDYAVAQAQAGADAIQIFESSAQDVEEQAYLALGRPWFVRLIQRLRERLPDLPIIAFARGIGPHLGALARAGAGVLSIDASLTLGEARRRLNEAGWPCALQGNLAPEWLKADPQQAGRAAVELLQNWRNIVPYPERTGELGPTGWVFNLAHGVPAEASPDALQAVMNAVREYRFDI